MIEFKRVIKMKETDATGAVYFTALPSIALELFEDWLAINVKNVKDFFKKEGVLLPIVNLQANYCEPIFWADEIFVKVNLDKIGTSSFSYKAIFYNIKEKQLADVSITHVCVDALSAKSRSISSSLRELLEKAYTSS